MGRLLHFRLRPIDPPRFKPSAPRVTRKLMAPGSPWDARLQQVGWHHVTRLIARWIIMSLGVDSAKAARDLAGLASHVPDIRELCVPCVDPHANAAIDYAEGRLTLAEVHGFLLGLPGSTHGAPRIAGLPNDSATAPPARTFRQLANGALGEVDRDGELLRLARWAWAKASIAALQ